MKFWCLVYKQSGKWLAWTFLEADTDRLERIAYDNMKSGRWQDWQICHIGIPLYSGRENELPVL